MINSNKSVFIDQNTSHIKHGWQAKWMIMEYNACVSCALIGHNFPTVVQTYLRLRVDDSVPGQCKNWAHEIRKILREIGCEYIWESENAMHSNFIDLAKQTLIDLYINEWHTSLSSSSKYINYVLYRSVFCHENYLCSIKSYKHRRALSCLRLSSHSLEIEVGRYHPRTPWEQRTCRYCQRQDIEDEFHFILVCDQYNTLRRKLIPRYYWQRPNMVKYIDMMKSDEMSCIVAKYIFDS